MTKGDEFRYVRKGDIIKVIPRTNDKRGLIRRGLDTVKESIHEMVRSIDGTSRGDESRREGDQ